MVRRIELKYQGSQRGRRILHEQQMRNATSRSRKNKSDFTEVVVPEEKGKTSLPDVSTTLSGSWNPLHLNYESSTVETLLEDENGGILQGEGLKLLLLTVN